MSKFGAQFRATMDLAPMGSHVVLLSLTVVMTLCLAVSFLFEWLGLNYWLPLAPAGVLFITVTIFWFVSRRDIDAHSTSPTNIVDVNGSRFTSLTTDASSLESTHGRETLERILSVMQHRSPLPAPDGLIDEQGAPIPSSESEARTRIESINLRVKEEMESIVFGLRVADDGEDATQHAIDHEPDVTEINEVNKRNEEP